MASDKPDEHEFTDEDAEEIARAAAAASKAESTLIQIGYRFRGFERHCERRGVSSLPAEPGEVKKYLAYRSTKTKPKCVALDLNAIRYYHSMNNHPDPTATRDISQVMAGIKRLHGTASVKKTALATAAIREMCLNFDIEGGALAIRNKAAVLTGFAGAFRSDDLTKLKFKDLVFELQGVVIVVPKSKTDQEAKGQEVAIANGEHPETNPVLALKEWFEVYELLLGRKLLPHDPILPALRRVGDPIEKKVRLYTVPMTKTCYREVLKEAAEAVGLNPKDISGHSCRRGHATQAARNGAARADIAKQGRWKSTQVMDGYIDEGRRFEDNSSRHLGL